MAPDFSAEELRQMFDYRAEEGLFIWSACHEKGKRWNTRWVGAIAGSLSNGRRYVTINYRKHANYHLVWYWETGKWPEPEIDHIDCNEGNDRFGNLRLATRTLNMRNIRRGSTNTSGFKGVCWDKARGKWIASISVNSRFRNLGRFDAREDAHAAVVKASRQIAGEFARAA